MFTAKNENGTVLNKTTFSSLISYLKKHMVRILYVTMSADEAQHLTKFPFNRSHKSSNIKSLKESMRKYGFIQDLTCIWTKVFGTWELIIADGNGRWQSAIDLGIDINMKIQTFPQIETKKQFVEFVGYLNTMAPWNINDFIRTFARAGFEEYQKIVTLHNEYSSKFNSLKLSTLSHMLMNINSTYNPACSTVRTAIKRGKFQVTCFQSTVNTLELCLRINQSARVSGRIIKSVHKIRLNKELHEDSFVEEMILLLQDIEENNLRIDNFDSIVLKAHKNSQARA